LRPTHTAAVNSTAFEAGAGADPTYAIVAQAYYQLAWPLAAVRADDQPASRVQATVGKLDFFAFFDQNAVAGDESAAFLNNVFVHNPLLDSGGDIAADKYGFAPGAQVAYVYEGDHWAWGASLGVFASGDGANFNASPGRPLLITQVEVAPKLIHGEHGGNYRAYLWTNGRTTDFAGNEQRHTGFGLSVDQRMGGHWNLFGRYGRRTSGRGAFDRAWTAGFEQGGRWWGRGSDGVGVAFGLMSTSGAWSRATAADLTLAGFAAAGPERVAELYYRMKINDKLAITPDVQLVQRPGGDVRAPSALVFGVRATLGF
jgi:high affinity Mn2+ porin